ncbi:MAG: hypothetical protein LBL74_00330 [Bacteroidales bacterium]|nr:hypothetical protein [Bacteroidales bacterium]
MSEIYLIYTNNNYTYDNVGNTLTIKGNTMDNFNNSYTYDVAYCMINPNINTREI